MEIYDDGYTNGHWIGRKRATSRRSTASIDPDYFVYIELISRVVIKRRVDATLRRRQPASLGRPKKNPGKKGTGKKWDDSRRHDVHDRSLVTGKLHFSRAKCCSHNDANCGGTS